MKILIFGAGAIGTIYGYFLSRAGNEVVHYVRENRAGQLRKGIDVNILDGRDEKNMEEIRDHYTIRTITDFKEYREFDLMMVSVKHGSLEGVLQVLKENSITGDILFFNGLWKDYSYVDNFISRERYLWGYPVAGGNMDYENRKLEGAILDHILLGETDGKKTKRLEMIKAIFEKAKIKVETPKDVLHWIWIHMAVNAGVISTCLKYGSAPAFMDNVKALREGILTMREALKVVEARGVNLNDYKNEIKMYYYPALFSSILFKHYFKKNILARKIMELHNNLEDLYELCGDVYGTAKALNISTPLLTNKEKYFLAGQNVQGL